MATILRGSDNLDSSKVLSEELAGSIVTDASGRVTMPYQPAFQATGHSGGAWYNTTYSTIPWGRLTTNIGNHFSTATGRFTAPVSGVYEFSWSALHRCSGNGGMVYLRVNGTAFCQLAHFQSNGDEYEYAGGSVQIQLSAGDWVDSYIGSNSLYAGIYLGMDSSPSPYSVFGGRLVA